MAMKPHHGKAGISEGGAAEHAPETHWPLAHCALLLHDWPSA
jgi:hypothetical protein